jgi:Domain of unknown function (DUF4232)
MKSLSRSRRLPAALALACAAILVSAAAALAAEPSHASHAGPAAPAAPACRSAHPALRGGAFVWSGNPGDGFAGGVSYEVEITNSGRRPCTVRGVPGLAAVSGGHVIGSRQPGSSHGPLVTLRPGATAHFGLTVNVAGAICLNPVSADVTVYLYRGAPGQSAYLQVAACPGRRGGGVLHARAIRPGTGIPLYDI